MMSLNLNSLTLHRRRTFALLLFSLLLSGCTGLFSPPTPVVVPSLREQDGAVPKIGVFNSVSGLATIQVTIDGESFGGSHALFAEAPNKLRAELYGLFGRPIYLLVNDGESLSYLLPGENRYFKSPSSAESFYRLTHIPLAGDDFVGLLLGRLPTVGDAEVQMHTDVDGNAVLTRTGTAGLSQELRFNQNGRLTVGRLWREDHLLLTAEYSTYTDEGFAATIRLEFPDCLLSVLIEFDTPTVGGAIPPERFNLAIPEDAIRINLNDNRG